MEWYSYGYWIGPHGEIVPLSGYQSHLDDAPYVIRVHECERAPLSLVNAINEASADSEDTQFGELKLQCRRWLWDNGWISPTTSRAATDGSVLNIQLPVRMTSPMARALKRVVKEHDRAGCVIWFGLDDEVTGREAIRIINQELRRKSGHE